MSCQRPLLHQALKKELRSEIKTRKQVSGSGRDDHESRSTLGDLRCFSQ